MNFSFGEVQTFVSDLTRAVEFYQKKLGLTIISTSADWAIFNIQGIELVLMAGAKPNAAQVYKTLCQTVICLKTSTIEKDVDNLRKNGVKIYQEIQTVPQGRFAVIQDPDQNFIEIIQH